MTDSGTPRHVTKKLKEILCHDAANRMAQNIDYSLVVVSRPSGYSSQSIHWAVAAVSTTTPHSALVFNVYDRHGVGPGEVEMSVSLKDTTFDKTSGFLGGVCFGNVHPADLPKLQKTICGDIAIPDSVDRDCRAWTEAVIKTLAANGILHGSTIPLMNDADSEKRSSDMSVGLASRMREAARLTQAQDGVPVFVPFSDHGASATSS